MTRVEKVKSLAENIMQEQLELQKELMELDFIEITEFNQWYRNHPIQQEIVNIIESMKNIRSQLQKI